MKHFDVLVIGAGPAGYTAAIRCAQLGLDTACVDRWTGADGSPALGGTCINAGCIPSKALLESSEEYAQLLTHHSTHGIRVDRVGLDIAAMQERKQRIVHTLAGGIAELFEKNAVTWFQGHAHCLGDMQVQVRPVSEEAPTETLRADNIVIATGSETVPMSQAPINGERIVDSTGALEFIEVPKRLGIIGGGVIGLEMGSVWNRLGAKVILLEAREEFLPPVDRQVAELAYAEFKRQGLDIRLGARVTASHAAKTQVRVDFQDAEGEHSLKFERLIVAVGRRPVASGLFGEESGILLDEGGRIQVDEYCRTDVANVYAIGDAVRGPMLAHKGAEEGLAVAETIAGTPRQVDYDRIPWVIYTSPELAWVGRNEHQLRSKGIDYRVGSFPFRANGRARAMEQTTGLVKVLADAETDAILGVHLFGPGASELVNEATLSLAFAASAEDLAHTCHAHPSLSETLREAAMAVGDRAIHM
jgi:dihydrolipoamide dehydrogenase